MATRYDISRLQPAIRLSDGRIRADAHLTRCGVFVYHLPDGRVRRELRPAEEVFRPDSLASFAQAPVTDDHPPEMLTTRNTKRYACGALGESVTRDGDHVRGKIGVYDADLIAKMDAGKLDVSLGYNCDLEERSGVDPVYGPYDAIQRNIVGNHVAIVERGRAGSAKARMDGMTCVLDYSEEEDRGPDGKWTGRSGGMTGGSGGNSGAKAEVNASPGKIADVVQKFHEQHEVRARAASDKANTSGKFADHIAAYKEHASAAAANSGSTREAHLATADKHLAAAKAAPDAVKEQVAKLEAQRDADRQLDRMGTHVLDHAGTPLASRKNRAKLSNMPTKSKVDAEEERKLALAAKADAKDPDDDPEDSGEEGDEEDGDEDDGYEGSDARDTMTVDAADGEPSQNAPELPSKKDPDADGDDDTDSDEPDHDKIAAQTYAIPKRKEMPIHSPEAVNSAMEKFGDHPFKSADEKHAAFNRVGAKAAQFGVPKDKRQAFQDAHGNKLDRADSIDPKDPKYMSELKKTQERLDAVQAELAKAQGQIEGLKKDADAAIKARMDAETQSQARTDAKIELLVKAKAVGAEVDSKMTTRQIHCAVIKHIDKVDVADDKHDAYAEALFDHAMSHAKTDALETLVGAEAIAAARGAVVAPTVTETKNDAADDEEAAARKMKTRTQSLWTVVPSTK